MPDDFADDVARDENEMAERPEGSVSRREVLLAGTALAAAGLAPASPT